MAKQLDADKEHSTMIHTKDCQKEKVLSFINIIQLLSVLRLLVISVCIDDSINDAKQLFSLVFSD